MRIALIGPRASGKTVVGRRLAKLIGCEFIDLDELTAAQFDQPTVEAIWAAYGESAWRAAELRSLREVLSQPREQQVIALGGGAPMIHEAQPLLIGAKARGLRVVYLRCPLEVLVERLTRAPGDRPSLTGKGIREEIEDVLAQREPTYHALADVVIDAAGRIDHIVSAVHRSLKTERRP